MALSDEQYNQIMGVYDERQSVRRLEIERRKKQLYARLPEVAEMEDEIRRMAIAEVGRRLGRSVAKGENKNIQKIQKLHQKKIRAMGKAGFDEDFLEVPFVCEVCQDTGYVNGKRCSCFSQLSLELFGDSHTDQLEGHSLQDFSLEFYPEDFIEETLGRSSQELAALALKRARLFVSQFDTSFENLLLIGKTGTGKTHLSSCIGGELLSKGYAVYYLTAFELFATMKKEAFSRDERSADEFERLFSCDLLIIDDLGTEFATAMTNSWLFELVNERIRRRVSTLISTNLELVELGENYTERMVSRFVEYYIPLKLAGPDIRILKAGVR